MAENRPRPRILTLSDLIFGLALSISALSLVGQQATTTPQFITALGLYALSFYILLNVWRSYSETTSTMPEETALTTRLHYLLLFLVSIEPYLFDELFTGTGSFPSTVSQVYALDVGFMFIILGVFNHALSKERVSQSPKEFSLKHRRLRNRGLLVGLIFVVSALPLLDSVVLFSFVIKGVTSDFTLRTALWLVGPMIGLGAQLMTNVRKD